MMKWGFVPRQSPKPKYIVCNADESEPGTCKDRPLIENDPHQLIEACIIAGWALESHQGYIYVRGEYRYLIDILDRALGEAYSKGYLGDNILGTGFKFDLFTHTGAGAYECGEETALLNSLEGLRGFPRIKPPFPAFVGLYGAPTVVAADVDVALMRLERPAGDDAGFDQLVGVVFDQGPVLAGARLALVGVADYILRLGRLPGDEAPLHPRGESCAAPATEIGFLHCMDNLIGCHRERLLQTLVAVVLKIDVD